MEIVDWRDTVRCRKCGCFLFMGGSELAWCRDCLRTYPKQLRDSVKQTIQLRREGRVKIV
jgi:hypothetical protein